MTDASGLQASLAAMGFVELALAFIGLACYALVLNTSLGPTGRYLGVAGATLAGGGFIAMTDPWVNGFSLVAIAVAGLGAFSAVVWGLSAAFGLNSRVSETVDPDTAADAPEPANIAASGPSRPHSQAQSI